MVAVVIFFLDVAWIRNEMNKPGWDGTPDMDIVFHLGMLFRIIVINTLLLPVSALGIWRKKRRLKIKNESVGS